MHLRHRLGDTVTDDAKGLLFTEQAFLFDWLGNREWLGDLFACEIVFGQEIMFD
ncbi:hypothetical protein RBI14_16215 [Alcaligenaceae bacterium B3P038]|nr:hypothetical protein [Alcaligenaceae bacterium B3P038]